MFNYSVTKREEKLRRALLAITHTGDKVSMIKTAKQALQQTEEQDDA